jgi:hypothetical protein
VAASSKERLRFPEDLGDVHPLADGAERHLAHGQRSIKKLNERANSSQQPTTCRSLARRFRASFSAALCVARPDGEGTWRLSDRTLARPEIRNMLVELR